MQLLQYKISGKPEAEPVEAKTLLQLHLMWFPQAQPPLMSTKQK